MLANSRIFYDQLPTVRALDMGTRRRSRLVFLKRWHYRHGDQAQWSEQQAKQKPDTSETSLAIGNDPTKHRATYPDK